MNEMETISVVINGIGLSAACGFRIFVLFLLSVLPQSMASLLLASGFEWMGGYYAMIAFASATALEVIAYYVLGLTI